MLELLVQLALPVPLVPVLVRADVLLTLGHVLQAKPAMQEQLVPLVPVQLVVL
jgi:hypothetical protein